MDPVSFAASILTLTSVLPSSAKVVYGLIRAPTELQDLANRLCHLASAVDTVIEIATAQGCQQCTLDPLHSIRNRIRVVQTSFDTQIRAVNDSKSSPRFRRITWIRRMNEIKRIRTQMAMINDDFVTAMNTLLLSSLGTVLQEIRQNHDPSGAFRLPNLLLERSGRSYPEIYIVEQPQRQQLLVFSMHEVECTATLRVAKYHILCPIDARHWRKVLVLAKRPINQRQSQVPTSRTSKAYKTLPGTIQPRLQEFLEMQKIGTYNSVIQVHIELEVDAFNNVTFTPENSKIHQDPQDAFAADTSKYIDEIRCRGLPQYCESDVLTLKREFDHFFVLVGGEVNIECKLPFSGRAVIDQDLIENFVTNMNLMLAAQGCVGIPKFSGFVVDDNRTQLQSYLLEAPWQGCMWILMAVAKEAGESITWTRRERWFRQLIATTAEIHKRGLVAGYHGEDFYSFFIDSNDDVKIVLLQSRRKGLVNHSGYLAPELRKFTKFGADAKCYTTTAKIDIFNLGLILWQLVNYIKIGNHATCRMNNCGTLPRYRCTAEHTNPTLLPFDDNFGVPTYVQTIIDHCRQDEPSKRLSAAELLLLIPPEKHSSEYLKTKPASTSWQDLDRPAMSPTCDECGNTAPREHHHCYICAQGNFDLCSPCYAKPIRCFHSNHVMVRRINKTGAIINAPIDSKLQMI